MKSTTLVFGVLLVIIIVLQVYNFRCQSDTKNVKFDVTLINGTHKLIEKEVPKYANFHIYEQKLQYKELNGYYRTIYYNVIDFKIIE
jgi:hypothetical protein